MTVSIDILVVTHHGGALLEKCLRSIRRQTMAPAQVVVVFSSDAAPPENIDFHLLRTKLPSDFAPAANLGLAHLGKRPVVLLNDDTEIETTFLQSLQSAYVGPGIYQPRIVDPNGRIDNTGHWVFVDGFNIARDRGTHHPRSAGPCGAFSGAAVMFSPEVLAQVGTFDPDFGAYGEDLDLSLRAIRQGFGIHHVPDAIVTHQLGATYGRNSNRKVYLVERNRIQAAIRSLPWSAIVSLPATTSFRLCVMGTAALGGTGLGASVGWRGGLAALAGMAAGVWGSPRALRKRFADQESWKSDSGAMWRHLREQAPTVRNLAGVDIRSP